jgi:ArsR family transcriptional regulator
MCVDEHRILASTDVNGQEVTDGDDGDGGEAGARALGGVLRPGRVERLRRGGRGGAARSFAALADPIRLRLFNLIAAAGDEVCNCDLIEPVGRSQPTVSHHLKILRGAGLVEADKRGIWVWYRVVPGRLEQLRAALR